MIPDLYHLLSGSKEYNPEELACEIHAAAKVSLKHTCMRNFMSRSSVSRAGESCSVVRPGVTYCRPRKYKRGGGGGGGGLPLEIDELLYMYIRT